MKKKVRGTTSPQCEGFHCTCSRFDDAGRWECCLGRGGEKAVGVLPWRAETRDVFVSGQHGF